MPWLSSAIRRLTPRWLGRPDGPGLRESLIWVWGIGVAHVVSSLLMLAFLALVYVGLQGGELSLVQLIETNALEQWIVPWLGGEQLLCLLLILWAVRRRGVVTWNGESLRTVRASHWWLTTLLILPIGVICSAVYVKALEFWRVWTAGIPQLSVLDAIQPMNLPELLAQRSNLLTVMVILAIVPAVGEELVFRGVIGKGLTHRLGMWRGVFLTSVLFGAIHFHPAHAVGVIPLGVALHVVTLWTGSLWPAMLLHFLNNALAIVTLTWGKQWLPVAAQDLVITPPLIAASLFLVGCIFWGMYRTRVGGERDIRSVSSGPVLLAPRSSHSYSSLYFLVLTEAVTLFFGIYVRLTFAL